MQQNPTKQQEIDHFRAFVEALPSGCYLRSIFLESPGVVEGMIRNDFAYDPLPEIRHAIAEATDDLKTKQAELVLLEKNIKDRENYCMRLAREKEQTETALSELRKQALRLANSK